MEVDLPDNLNFCKIFQIIYSLLKLSLRPKSFSSTFSRHKHRNNLTTKVSLKTPPNTTQADKNAPMPTSTKIPNVKLSTITSLSLVNRHSQTFTKEIKTFALLLSSVIQKILTTPLQLVPEAQLFTHRLITSTEFSFRQKKG